MEANAELRFARWETGISDLDGLYFVELVDSGDILRLIVEDRARRRYEVVAERAGPYRVTEEQHLVHYWDAIEEGLGWTFRVDGAGWVRDLSLLEHYVPGVHHYVIATLDTCLEVLAAGEPLVRSL